MPVNLPAAAIERSVPLMRALPWRRHPRRPRGLFIPGRLWQHPGEE